MGTKLWLAVALLGAGDVHVCPTCGHAKATGLWLTIGFLGQAVFTARFLAQWVASERRRDSVVPVVFWWLSLAGGLILLSYAVHNQDPVISVGQSMGVFIYLRNLMLVARKQRKEARRRARAEAAAALEPRASSESAGVGVARPHLAEGTIRAEAPAA
jgi:lipid-A-disaccharide synthase-like uncharacterized protein